MGTGPVQPASRSGAKPHTAIDPMDALIGFSDRYASVKKKLPDDILYGEELSDLIGDALVKGADTAGIKLGPHITGTKLSPQQYPKLRAIMDNNLNKIEENKRIRLDIRKRAGELSKALKKVLREPVSPMAPHAITKITAGSLA